MPRWTESPTTRTALSSHQFKSVSPLSSPLVPRCLSLRLSAALFSSILLAHRQRNCYSKRGSRRDPGEDSASHADVFEARSFSTLAKSTCHLEVRNLASSSSCSLSWRTLATELSSLIAERLGEDLADTARTHFLHWETRTRRNVAFGRRSRVEMRIDRLIGRSFHGKTWTETTHGQGSRWPCLLAFACPGHSLASLPNF